MVNVNGHFVLSNLLAESVSYAAKSNYVFQNKSSNGSWSQLKLIGNLLFSLVECFELDSIVGRFNSVMDPFQSISFVQINEHMHEVYTDVNVRSGKSV